MHEFEMVSSLVDQLTATTANMVVETELLPLVMFLEQKGLLEGLVQTLSEGAEVIFCPCNGQDCDGVLVRDQNGGVLHLPTLYQMAKLRGSSVTAVLISRLDERKRERSQAVDILMAAGNGDDAKVEFLMGQASDRVQNVVCQVRDKIAERLAFAQTIQEMYGSLLDDSPLQ